MKSKSQTGKQSFQSVHPSAPEKLIELLYGGWKTRAISTATKLGIPDLLLDGPQTIHELATSSATHTTTLYRLLRALTTLDIFAELPAKHDTIEQRRFEHTEISRLLCTQGMNSFYDPVQFMTSSYQWQSMNQLEYSIRTGSPAFELTYGKSLWQYFDTVPEEYEVFEKAMTSLSQRTHASLLQAYDFSHIRTLVDVGGGYGGWLASLLQAYPRMYGCLFEQEQVIGEARSLLEQALPPDRWTCAAGSFLLAVPPEADLYILKSVLHDWSDEQCIQILSNCRKAMHSSAQLLIIESVITHRHANNVTFMDLQLLAVTGGRERSKAEYQRLLEAAGFTMTRLLPTTSFYSIIEATVS